MTLYSSTPEETARLDAKIAECKRLHWKLLGMREAPVEFVKLDSPYTSTFSGLPFNAHTTPTEDDDLLPNMIEGLGR